MKAEIFDALRGDLAARRPAVLVTELPSGAQRLIHSKDDIDNDPILADAIKRALNSDQALTVEREGAPRVFVQPFNPPLRMIIVGAVHVAQPLAKMAALSGFDVTIIDPRTAFATEERFPGVARVTVWPDRALVEQKPDRRTAVITLTHDPKLDDPALESALRSEAFYVGALGSGKTHAARLGRLRARGFDDTAISRIHGPVGLRIGARSPAEIAVSILAEVVQVLRQKNEP